MTNNQLMSLLRSVIVDGLNKQGVANVRVLQNFPSKKTAAPNGPCVVFHRFDDQPVHWQYRQFAVKPTGEKVTTDSQNFETKFQINALVPRVNPEDESLTDLAAEDLLQTVHMILQSQLMLDTCKNAGINILNVSSFMPNWVKDEHDNWGAEPSFNLTVASKKQLVWETPAVDEYEWSIHPV